DVVARRPDEILLHLPVALPTELDQPNHISRVVLDEDHISRLDGYVRTAANGDPDVRTSQRGCVVDAITYHGHELPARLEFLDLLVFGFWKNFREVRVDPQLVGDRASNVFALASKHRHLDTEIVERVDDLIAIITDHVRKRERCNRLVPTHEIDARLGVRTCFLGECSERGSWLDLQLSE